jgi:hypothetical protein
VTLEAPQIRFAEDIVMGGPAKPQSKAKKQKKKKGAQDREEDERGTSRRRQRREAKVSLDDDEY